MADPTIAAGERPWRCWVIRPTPAARCSTSWTGKQWIPVVKPWPLRPAVEGGFTIDDFTHDAASDCLTCPAGITRNRSLKGKCDLRSLPAGSCPLAGTMHHLQVSGRTVLLGEHHQLQREHRKRAPDENFQAIYRQHRPMVERSIAWLTRGARRVPYRGIEKNNNWLHHRIAALNLRRLPGPGPHHPGRVLRRPETDQRLRERPHRRSRRLLRRARRTSCRTPGADLTTAA